MTALTPTDDDAAAVPSSRAPRQGLWPLLVVHAGLFAGGAVVLSLDPPAQGWGVLVVVAAYVVALLAGPGFAGAEALAPTLGLWEPVGDTTRIVGVAVYVVPAEVALGWAAATAFALVRHRPLAVRAGAALAVSTFYLGALVLAHFVIDVADWTITT